MITEKVYKKGQVWVVKEARSPGTLAIRLLSDVPRRVTAKDDVFFDAEIIKGRKGYVSIENTMMQKFAGKGTSGTVERFRRTLTRFIRLAPGARG